MREDYARARKAGEKSVHKARASGKYPYLLSLQSLLPDFNRLPKIPVGVREIPLHMIDGTVNDDRQNAFSWDFMPVFDPASEFAMKWSNLFDSQAEEGIHDAIRCYEYMQRFYVEEGNKRVSVLRFVDAYSIAADVIRVMPKKTDDPAMRAYFEFLDFYGVTELYDIALTETGSYARLAALYGMNLTDAWPAEYVETLRSDFRTFEKIFTEKGGDRLNIGTGDAFLMYRTLYPDSAVFMEPRQETARKIEKIWNELISATDDEDIAVVENPKQSSVSAPSVSVPLFGARRYTKDRPLRVAFLYSRTPKTSRWIYAHELGRNELNQKYDGIVDAILFEQCDTDEKANAAFDAAASDLDDVVFAVTPDLMTSCMRAAIRYPQMKILDCSINLKSSAVRTYYPKMYQAKFLMGALAACYANDHRIGYVADYPLNGNIANINAFAIGAGIVDPKAKIYLSWTGRKGNDFEKELEDDLGLKVISGPDAIQPASHSRKYGLYVKDDSGRTKVIAAPICHWGKFYSAIVQTILDGTWNEREKTGKNQPINYWLGMPGGVVDVIFSDKLPYYSRKLLKILKSGVMDGTIEPFRGELRSQSGTLQTEGAEALSYADIVGMDWLNDNIIGSVPKADELVESVQKTVQTSGVTETVRQDDRQK